MTEDARGEAPRSELWLLLLADVVTRLAFAARPLAAIDKLTLPDDTYISLEVARNIAKGLGPLYGLAPTSGFQPLYVLAMVPAFWVWPTSPAPPVHAALVLASAFDAATLWTLYRWIREMTGSRRAAACVGVAWVLNPYVLSQTLNGLETAMAVFFVAASFATFHRLVAMPSEGISPCEPRLVRALGVWLGLAIFARIDGLLATAVIGIALIVRWHRTGRTPRAIAFACGTIAALAFAINVPRLVYSLATTGDWTPASGAAVRFMSLDGEARFPSALSFYLRHVEYAALALWDNHTSLLAATLIAALVYRVASEGRGARLFSAHTTTLVALAAYSMLLVGAYTFYVFGSWFYPRYLFPAVIPLLVLLGVVSARAFDAMDARSPGAGKLATAGVFLLAALGVGEPRFRALYLSDDVGPGGYMKIGQWARDHFAPGSRIGSLQSGAMSYFASDLVVVNLDGVVNRAALEALRANRDVDYVRSAGLRYLVDWEEGDGFVLRHSPARDASALPVVRRVDDFTTQEKTWLVYEVK